jgi:hypothetical protein
MREQASEGEKLPWRVEVPFANMEIDEFVLWKEQERQRNIIETRKPLSHT